MEQDKDKTPKKIWSTPMLREVGNLKDIIKASGPKSHEGDDTSGSGGGGSEHDDFGGDK